MAVILKKWFMVGCVFLSALQGTEARTTVTTTITDTTTTTAAETATSETATTETVTTNIDSETTTSPWTKYNDGTTTTDFQTQTDTTSSVDNATTRPEQTTLKQTTSTEPETTTSTTTTTLTTTEATTSTTNPKTTVTTGTQPNTVYGTTDGVQCQSDDSNTLLLIIGLCLGIPLLAAIGGLIYTIITIWKMKKEYNDLEKTHRALAEKTMASVKDGRYVFSGFRETIISNDSFDDDTDQGTNEQGTFGQELSGHSSQGPNTDPDAHGSEQHNMPQAIQYDTDIRLNVLENNQQQTNPPEDGPIEERVYVNNEELTQDPLYMNRQQLRPNSYGNVGDFSRVHSMYPS